MSYQPHASDDLSANFTLNQTYDELSANLTLNQQIAELSANFRVHNILAYFQHAVESTTGANFIEPSPIDNYVIRQANRDKVATIDVMYSNSGDRFSWVTPQSILQVFAGTNVDNKTKIFGGRVKEPEWQGENIIFHGQGYGEELLRRRITDAIYDIEATDLIKNHLLSGTSITTSSISFIGEETTRSSFHTDSYSDESNIESTSNVTLTGGTWDLDLTTDPSGGDSWTENNSSDWDVDEGNLTLSDEGSTVQEGSYSIKIAHAFAANLIALYHCDEGSDTTVGDSSANNYDLTTNSDWTGSGKFDSALDFGGATPQDYAYNNSALDTMPANGTMELWINPDDMSNSPGVVFVYKDASNYMGIYLDTDNVPHFLLQKSGSPVYNISNASYTAPDATWTHVAATWGSNGAKLYVNGTERASDASTDYHSSHADNVLYVGATYSGNYWFDGQVDEVQISNVQKASFNTTTEYPDPAENREAWYISSKDLSKNLNQKVQIDFYIRQDDADDEPQLRLYSSAGNYYYRTVAITDADTFENKTYAVGSGAAGWSSIGSPDWTDIDWIAFYWTSAQTTLSETFIDALHFDQYETSGYIISDDLTTISEASTSTQEYFDDVKIDVTKSEPDVSHYLTIQACNDDGTTYETFTDNTWGTFTDHHSSTTNHGRTFKYKILFTGDGSDSPELSAISIDVKTKLITVYDRIEYDNETLFDAIKDVLYDASLEGYTDTSGIYQLALVQDKTTTDFIPPLRQGYEILKEPTWKKDSKTLSNYLKGRGADEGANTKAEQDQWTEQHASSWSGTNMTISDESSSSYVKEGDYCIKLVLEGTGFVDNCDDASINTDYYDYDENLTQGTVTETTYIQIQTRELSSTMYNASLIFDASNYSLTGNYDISFDVYSYGYVFPAFYELYALFIIEADFPKYGTTAQMTSYGQPILWTSGKYVNLWQSGSGDSTIYTHDSSTPGWYTIRITRSGSTVTIYVNGEQAWSGTLTEDTGTHDNIQFGMYRTDLSSITYRVRIDNINWNYSVTGGNALTPSFNKNLDVYENLYCWYRTDGSDTFSIRLETDASNYFSRDLTPQKLNTAYELRLPVGSKSAGWSETGSPDWTNLTQLRFVYGAGVNIATVYLDKLFFTIEPVETTYEDTTSQSTHGTYEGKTYVNKQITAIDELEDRLKAIVDSYKNLNEPLDLVVYGRRDISTGDLVKVYFPKAGIDNVVFRVDEVHYLLGTMTLTRLFCRDIDTVSAANRLKKLDYETKQVK